jgi:hypothetical protein
MKLKEMPIIDEKLEPTAATPGLPTVIDNAPQAGGIGNFISKFFTPEDNNAQGQAIAPLWRFTSQALKAQRIHRHLPQALLTLIAMVSAHLHQPMAMFISPEPGIDGTGFLDSVSRLVHEDLKVDFGGLNLRKLSQNPSVAKGKVVIINDVHLPRSRQDLLRTLLQPRSAASLVALVDQPEPRWLNPLPALRINLTVDPEYIQQELTWRADSGQEHFRVEDQGKIVSKWMQRLRPAVVKLPFLEQIMDSLDKQDPMVGLKLAWIVKILNIVTIINRASSVSPQEMVSEYFDLDISATSGASNLSAFLPGADELVATKVDYYIFHKIAHDLFAIDDSPMTPRQTRVFEAIKASNLKIITQGATFMDAGATSAREIFQTLDYQERLHGWPSIDDIHEAVGRDGGVTIPRPIVEREIAMLLSQGLILNRRHPTPPGQLRYRVTTLTVGRRNELPHPSKIIEPVYEGNTVDVTDLLAGELETI